MTTNTKSAGTVSTTKELIEQLISEGRTEEALAKLAQTSDDGVLLLSRYNNGKKQFNMGMIEFGEWSRIQSQINWAALETARQMSNNTPSASVSGSVSQSAQPALGNNDSTVFISYNHKDQFVMRAIKAALAEEGIGVHIDIEDMEAGEPIQGFIDEAFKKNGIVLTIISQNSLLSGWVNKELNIAKVLNTLNNNWIPISIDDAVFNSSFIFDAFEIIDKKILELRGNIKRALDADLDISAFTDELKRQQDLKNNISSTIAELKRILVVNISGDLFEPGMKKVIQKIKNLKK